MPEEFERSDKIPLSVDSMLFKLLNRKACRVSHRGVLEFTAEEGMIYMPYWMMKNMHLQEGDRVIVESVTLSKGTHSKFQPHTGDFFDIPDSNDLLGTILRNFSCLTTGDRIMVTYEEQKYYIDIVKSKPANAISIIETRTDCKVRYASPLYPKEPEKPIASRSAGKAPEAEEDHLQFTDRGIKYTLDSEIANKLFPHQLEAINWLWHLHCLEGGGGILADGMGLGKTYTVCSFISILLNCNLINRILMISPPTLLTHWTNELAGVGLSSYITSYHSVSTACRPQLLEDFMDRDKGILVTTYGIATKDIEIIKGAGSEVKWDYLIIDEGQFIKNDETNRWRSLNGLQTFHRLIITGTPIQNNLKELWALLDFCTKQAYINSLPRKRKRDRDDVTEEFKDFIRPYILRRSESLISRHDEKNPIKKQELVVWLQLTEDQRQVYESTLEVWRRDFSTSKASARALTMIMMLKATCDHSLSKSCRLKFEGMEGILTTVKKSGERVTSCKILFLTSLLHKLVAEKHCVIIFSYTRTMLDLIQDCLTTESLNFIRIDGKTKTKDRSKKVEDFQNGVAPIFLSTSQVGGLGLNLTKADRVILVNPSWNPSDDDQSVFRAYRIGQKKDVLVYRLLTCGTIEEKIYKNQVYK